MAPTPELLQDLPDELLEAILLRLAAAADLARASTACATFHRLISADPSFLRRFRALHPPPAIGFLVDDDGFYPAVPPHPSAAAALAVAKAADFSFSFLPQPGPWACRDSRDGRVLVVRVVSRPLRPRGGHGVGSDEQGGAVVEFINLAVCDPLSRRYVLLPPILDKLTVPGEQGRLVDFEPVLAPNSDDDDEEASETSFRVVARAQYENKMVAFVFSSLTGQWRGFELDGWTAMAADVRSLLGVPSMLCCPFFYAHGCFYWTLPEGGDKLLVLDIRRMKVSIIQLPRGSCGPYAFAISEQGEGCVAIFTFPKGAQHLCYTIRRMEGEGAKGWHWNLEFEKKIPLPAHHRCGVAGATDGYLLIRGVPEDWGSKSYHKDPEIQYYSLELRTMKLERMCVLCPNVVHAELHTSFPPSLSLPRL